MLAHKLYSRDYGLVLLEFLSLLEKLSKKGIFNDLRIKVNLIRETIQENYSNIFKAAP